MSLITTFKDKLTKLRGRNLKEDGNSLVVTLLLFPVMFAVFGVAVDHTIATYTQATLQSALDNGAQSALSRALNPGEAGNTTLAPKLTYPAAQNYFRQFYDQNRSAKNDDSNPFLACQTEATKGELIMGPSGCGWTEQKFDFFATGNTLRLDSRVYEESHPIFIKVFGVDRIKYTLETSSRTTFATN